MIFLRCGLARRSDLETDEWRRVFVALEAQQETFSSRSARFLSEEYGCSRNPLHTWSRCWEYPYVYLNMVHWSGAAADGPALRVVDLGSGVTFFPFSLASRGFNVICTDTDPLVEKDMTEAIPQVPHALGCVDFQLIGAEGLPFEDSSIDAVYCISVLEHIPVFERTISEVARILKPKGGFFLTFDLDLRGDHEIGKSRYYDLKQELSRYFDMLYPETTAHPADVLTSIGGSYGYKLRTGFLDRVWFLLKQKAIKPLIGRKPEMEVPYYLAVEGSSLIKK